VLAADLGAGVRASVPISLLVDDRGTLPRTGSPSKAMPVKLRFTANDRATRLGVVIVCWNVFQHFYAYFDVVKTDWPQQLVTSLQAAALDRDAASFRVTLRKLVAALHDGHGSVDSADDLDEAPIGWDWIEGRLVVTAAAKTPNGVIQPGDAVTMINGKPALERLHETEAEISAATPQGRLEEALSAMSMGRANDALTLEVESYTSGERRVVQLKYGGPGQPKVEVRPDSIAELKPGVIYADLTRLNEPEWNAALPKFERAAGLIFDVRGSPRLGEDFLRYLVDKPITGALGYFPIITKPDRQDIEFEPDPTYWNLTPLHPTLKARKVFLTDRRAMSHAEGCMEIIEHYRIGEIVGGPTAGTAGDVNRFTVPGVPGGYRVRFTGLKALKHDGLQFHGVGIHPTVPVRRTRAGVAAGRDEVLERALAFFN
jgi:C-terminal processing protease CtpA/Prc